MKNAPMRFGGMSLHHNPYKLVIESENNIKELSSPCCEPDSIYLGAGRQRISGEGELYGADCMEQFAALEAMQKDRVLAKLSLPGRKTVYACLKELELTAEPVDSVLKYRFVFTQAQSPRKSSSQLVYHTAAAGESLWEIARAYDVATERLIELNPDIPYIDSVEAGRKVRVC